MSTVPVTNIGADAASPGGWSVGQTGRRLVAIVALLATACGPQPERPLQGYVEGQYVRVAAPFGGTLQQLSVQRGGDVAVGAPVFALEKDSEAAARRQAGEQLRAAEARLENLKSGKRPTEVATVAGELRQAIAARDLAASNLRRQQQLYASGFVSNAALDDARTQLQRDEAQVASLQASVATANLPARVDEIRAGEADAKAAREALAQADWRLAQRAITSPASGRVHDTYYVVGDFVPAGSPVASVLPPGNVRVRFYVPEPALGRLKAGQEVRVDCDGCAAPVVARIDYVSDRAEFTPPVLYSRDNRAKLVYRVEARPAATDTAKLHPGQPVDVTLPAAR